MFGQPCGRAKIRPRVTKDEANYPFGPLSDIEGKELPVLERNKDGDCLCLVNGGTGMADIRASAIQWYMRNPPHAFEF